MLDDPRVLVPLSQFLSTAELFRLGLFVLREEPPPEVVSLVATRMGLRPGRRHPTLQSLAHHMHANRCVECGVRTRRRPRVCEACGDPSSGTRVAMVTRVYIRAHRPQGATVRAFEAFVRALPVIKRTSGTGAFLYWRHVVDGALEVLVALLQRGGTHP